MAASQEVSSARRRKAGKKSLPEAKLSAKKLKEFYYTMNVSRFMDEKMLLMLRQGKSFFHIGASGHEAVLVAAANALKPGHDWSYPYYRDLTFALQLGLTPRENMLTFLARAEDPSSGGRQMPSHYGHRGLRIVSQSSPTGTQFLQAVGCAMSARRDGSDEVVYVSSGEGTTSQGDFHEAINWACREKAPVIFLVEDNGFAISVPIQDQTAGSSVYDMVAGYKGLQRFKVDGTDVFQSTQVFEAAVKHARMGKGPTVIVADVVRLLPHSSSDDHRKYRSEEDLASDRRRDPIPKLAQHLIENDIASEKELEKIAAQAKADVNEAADWAEAQPHPAPDTALKHVYSEEISSTSPLFVPPARQNGADHEEAVLVDAINHTMAEELERNERILIFGQDIADPKGGVFTATRGLSTRFGRERVFNSPLAESSIVGVAIGMATRGHKPVVEIQFGDYIWTAMMQIRNELATMRYRSNNNWACPVVIRVPVGGYIHGALCHSQCIDGYFAHIPGLRIAMPSNAADAKGLLRSAIRGEDPVIFMEHKGLYRQSFAKSPEPDAEYMLPFGKAAIKREGTDLSIFTWGMMLHRSMEAAAYLAKQGVSVEVVDLRTLSPLDTETVVNSVARTSKALVVYEDNLTHGFGAEVAARIADAAFEHLDGPIKRVAATDSPVPYNWYLEEVVLPQTSDIIKAAEELVNY